MPVYRNVHVLPDSPWLSSLQLQARNRAASLKTFVYASNQLIRLLLQHAAHYLPYRDEVVTTPIGDVFHGKSLKNGVCGVSVIRAGESMEVAFREMFPEQPIGKILIQRDKETKQPHYFYSHLPATVGEMSVMLFEPMLATGGSVLKAIDVLQESGVAADNIIVVNLLASPSGIENVTKAWPALTVVTSSIEQGMTEAAFMRPGIGDFGDRYFGTWPGASHE
ncbi:uracil phosphoribosyltransferase [Erwinia psidii]|uniref:Uracil phosphoribosyltransferase n=1 Tax=Erwinia psidii TaxID=69224 RepID=A0A3N6TSQ1_9GAMM|nr:uracil phosphoribosyltransferase [Erwinia psidii]MCX8957291.1 uracil phosphoribosyltransferase [Erwinia psidii]MCX8959662.1 uracil phosphoribosyltransferase [Erwinia psidii]MCX8964606.1 uracil phosphoribosyltransferase [Erwinia psidii]RQM38282.1 uracil phosphoribosyltransferase [Erwinia psidii]